MTSDDNVETDPVMVEHNRRMSIYKGYQSLPNPPEQQIKDGAHILSEILDDAAPLNERRYLFPAQEMLKYAAFLQQSHRHQLAVSILYVWLRSLPIAVDNIADLGQRLRAVGISLQDLDTWSKEVEQ